MKYYTLYLDEATIEAIRKAGKEQKRNLSNMIDFILDKYLKKESEK